MIPNKDVFKNKDFEPWKVSVYRKESALPGSLLKHRDFEVLCGCIVSVDKWQGKPGRGVKTKLFYGFGEIVS